MWAILVKNASFPNLIAMILGIIIFALLYIYIGNNKKTSFILTLLTVPILYFNTFFLVDAVTMDEMTYIRVFSDFSSSMSQYNKELWVRTSFQYRVSQVVFGSEFKLLKIVIPKRILGDNIGIIYKISHWLFFIMIACLIIYLWGMYILDNGTNELVHDFSVLGITYCLVGLPVSCLILKVANYDSGSIYFSILGISYAFIHDKCKKYWAVLPGVVSATFACAEKSTSLPYYIIILSIFSYLIIREHTFTESRKRIISIFLYAIGLACLFVLLSCFLCMIMFVLSRLISSNGLSEMNVGAILFPLIYLIRVCVWGGRIEIFKLLN